MDVDPAGLDVIEEYSMGPVKVYITTDGRYMVREPPVGDGASALYDTILKRISSGVDLGDDGPDSGVLAARLEEAFWDTAGRLKKLGEAKEIFPDLKYYIRREIIGYGILDPLMRDPDIEDILCSAYQRDVRVVHKRYSGRFHTLCTNVRFEGEDDMERFIQRIYGRTGTEPTDARPMSVTYMDDGSRISSTYGSQVSKPGPSISIRKFPSEPFTITHMLYSGTLTAPMAAYLWTLLDAKAVGLVIGATGSGKTTLLASLISMLNPRWRILTIEDTLELQIPHEDWVRLNTRRSYGMLSDKFDVTIRHLIDISLTQKPDYEIVGEIRLNDMDALFQSVGTGHGGLTSFHASSAEGALTRMRGNKISDGELGLLWFAARSGVIRRSGKSVRRVTSISEVIPGVHGTVRTEPVYTYDRRSDGFVLHGDITSHKRYAEALDICGIDDPGADMEKRIGLLEKCMEKKALNIKAVFGILSEYYSLK
ncbi:type IV secretory pathway component [Cenarchaeum symbiosum A]|uniref:Type IV secretory pathway component n=1 Tax=Cenarchaeum symbiosum (strain A) TaxID=414004 RepID=A0RVD3_CENSY|nr:type IV secretory pathway component [Cenarchaeum symbiosum A]